MGKIWHKFHPLFGSYLKVGFETTFPKGTALNLGSLYEKSGLIHDPPNEKVVRVYEPATKILGSCLDGDATQVFFEPVSPANSLFRRLMFFRNTDPKKPRHWMIAARFNETSHFGFDSWNTRNERYLPLAYPSEGVDGQFIPVYFKIQTEGGDFVYLEVWSWNEKSNVVIQARRVSEKEAPEHLISARPY